MRLQILHVTTYAYRAPVALLAHRMMLSPRGSHALRPISADLSCEPAAELEWTQDVFGNLVATASFRDPTDRLVITNRVAVEQTATAWPVFKIAPHAHRYPFDYSHEERTDLGALLVPEHPDPEGRLSGWARALVLGGDADTLSLLQDVNAAAGIGITYVTRDEAGTQSLQLTLDLGSGSCRDLATLFVEAVRHLGFAARAVSGYLFDPPTSGDPAGQGNQHGATHAWAEVYLPCAGWVPSRSQGRDPCPIPIGGIGMDPVGARHRNRHAGGPGPRQASVRASSMHRQGNLMHRPVLPKPRPERSFRSCAGTQCLVNPK